MSDSFVTPWTVAHQVPLSNIFQARILEWAAIPYFRGSSQPRDQTRISCIAGEFFTSWTTRESNSYQTYIFQLHVSNLVSNLEIWLEP